MARTFCNSSIHPTRAQRRPDHGERTANRRQPAQRAQEHRSPFRRGKTRASRNAYRHGLTLSITSTAEYAKHLETLVRKIAGDTKDAVKLERARAIAEADLELARVRRAKVALIERAS